MTDFCCEERTLLIPGAERGGEAWDSVHGLMLRAGFEAPILLLRVGFVVVVGLVEPADDLDVLIVLMEDDVGADCEDVSLSKRGAR